MKTLFLQKLFWTNKWIPHKSYCLSPFFMQTATDVSRQDMKIHDGKFICGVSTPHCMLSGINLLYFYKTSKYTLDVTHQSITWIRHDYSVQCNVFSKHLKEIEQNTPVRCASPNAVVLLLVVFLGVWNPLFLHYHLQHTSFFFFMISNFTIIT